jgi:predicted transcriptional regulator
MMGVVEHMHEMRNTMNPDGLRALIVEGDAVLPVVKALSSDTRQAMLGLLTHKVLNLSELATAMNLPHSTVSFNVNQLEAVGLVTVEVEPGTRGMQKLCSKRYDEVRIRLPGAAVQAESNTVSITMPIGSYRHLEAKPTCGIVSETKIIGMLDDPRSFFEPEHVHAQLLWFSAGYVEYAFPNNVPYGAVTTDLQLSMELCSEAPEYNEDWPSDITLWINDVEIGTWTSPGDFGGKRALHMPDWWNIEGTTYGLLKQWSVNQDCTMIDGVRLRDIGIDALKLAGANHIKVRLGVKEDARNQGGLNLFGRKFGNYPQDIVMRLGFEFPRGVSAPKQAPRA